MIAIDAEKMASFLNQIVENEGTQHFSVLYNEHKKVCSRTFLLKNTLLVLVCPHNNVCGMFEKAWSDRKNNALSFCKSHHYVNTRNSGMFLCHIKSMKNDHFFV